jgi:EAL domain-containing protein (putative c-di-GMP-specific phosphodiesterase class I)
LTRGPAGTNLERPEVLFEYARRKRAEGPVDRACVATALREAARLPGEPHLSINVHASTLARDHEFVVFFADAASSCGISLGRLTVEIVEHTLPWDRSCFLNALDGLRAVGVRIALDDVGLGNSNYRMMIDCRPQYFKIDGHFVHDVHLDFFRQVVLESVAKLALRFGGRVVAEAVEHESELATVARLGIDLVQGHLLGRAVPGSEVRGLLAEEQTAGSRSESGE